MTFPFDNTKDTLLLNKAADADFILKGRFKKDKKVTATVIIENENHEIEEYSVSSKKPIKLKQQL